ncbi:hypothetical protein H4R34_003790, partial [Dimargaris verticillata]
MAIVIPGANQKAPEGLQDAGQALQGIRLHQLPCWIDYDGPAKVDQFFLIQGKYKPQQPPLASTAAAPAVISPSIYVSNFRGRLLQGRRCPVPSGYKGYILKSKAVDNVSTPAHAPQDTSAERTVLMATERFGGFMVWDHDHPPHPVGDPLLKAMDWLTVAAL